MASNCSKSTVEIPVHCANKGINTTSNACCEHHDIFKVCPVNFHDSVNGAFVKILSY